MALSYVTYTGDNSTTQFAITFEYLAQANVTVKLDDVVQTQNTDYTINESTSQIVFTTAPGTDVVVRVERTTPIQTDQRVVDFTDGSSLSEEDLDNAVLQNLYISQEISDDVADLNLTPTQLTAVTSYANMRALTSPTVVTPLFYSNSSDGGFFSFDLASTAADDGVNTIKPDDKTVGEAGRWIRVNSLAETRVVATKTALETLNITGLAEGYVVYLSGRTAAGDGMEGHFWLDLSNSGISADDGTILAASGANNWWRRVYSGAVNVKWFGATGAGYPTDDRAAIQAAIDATGDVFFPAGTYYVSTPLDIDPEQRFVGEATPSSTTVVGALILGETDCMVMDTGSGREIHIENLGFSTRATAADVSGIILDLASGSGLNGLGTIKRCSFHKDLRHGIKGTIQGGLLDQCDFGTQGTVTNMQSGLFLDATVGNTTTKLLACRFRNSTYGIEGEEVNSIVCTACEFESLQSCGIYAKGVISLNVSGCYFENCRTDGASLDGFIRLDSSAGGTGSRDCIVSGSYFLNNGSINVDVMIAGTWVTALTSLGNHFQVGKSGTALYSASGAKPRAAISNALASTTFTTLDSENFMTEAGLGTAYIGDVVTKYLNAKTGITLGGDTRLNIPSWTAGDGFWSGGSEVYMLVRLGDLSTTERLLDFDKGQIEIVNATGDRKIRFVHVFSGTNYSKDTQALTNRLQNQWVWIRLTYNSSSAANDYTVYVNGEVFGPVSGTSAVGTATIPASSPFSIGGTDTGAAGFFMNGAVSRFMMFTDIDNDRYDMVIKEGFVPSEYETNCILDLNTGMGAGSSFPCRVNDGTYFTAVGSDLEHISLKGSGNLVCTATTDGYVSEFVTLSTAPNQVIQTSHGEYIEAIYAYPDAGVTISVGDSAAAANTIVPDTALTASVWTKLDTDKGSATSNDPYVKQVIGTANIKLVFVLRRLMP